MYHETKRLLKKAQLENKLVIFAGAGVSVNSGMPIWSEAILQIKSKLEPSFESEADALKIPQFYFNARGYKEYNELVKEIFSYADKQPNTLHRKILELKPYHIITTNYDDFLERVADENGEFLELIEQDSDIPYAKNSRMIIKMHGGFASNNYVLKEDDYLNYSHQFLLTETLIKSLIARNTVLFIGYSFNDPDTKQIFNWLKNVLGSDFQHAYMLLANATYNQTLFDYYKNLGINLIFPDVCLGEDYNHTSESIFDTTISCLDYLFVPEQAYDLVTTVRNKLSPYENLNYMLLSHISYALNLMGAEYRAYIEGVTLYVNDKRYFSFWKEVVAMETEESKELVGILNKSQLFYIADSSCRNHSSIIPTASPSEQHQLYCKYLCDRDFTGLSSLFQNVDVYDAKILLDDKFKLAFFYYKIGQLDKAIKVLKELSKLCKKQKNYIWHFIAEFNVKHLLRQNLSSTSTDLEAENLVEILLKYNIYSNEYDFLSQMSTFALFHNAYYKLSEMLKEVEKDVGNSGIQQIKKMECYTQDIHTFITSNHLMIDRYTDIKDLFRLFFGATLTAHLTPLEDLPSFFGGKVQAYRLPSIGQFAILCAIDYCDYKTLRNLFSGYRNQTISLDEHAIELLIKRTETYFADCEGNFIDYHSFDIIARITFIASKVLFDKIHLDLLMPIFTKILISGKFLDSFPQFLNNCIVSSVNRDPSLIDDAQLKTLIQAIINIQMVHRENTTYQYRHITALFSNLLKILHEGNTYVDNLLKEDDITKLIFGSGALMFLDVYPCCTIEAKSLLKSYVENSLSNNLDLYLPALKQQIIVPSSEIEDIIFSSICESQENNLGQGLLPNAHEKHLDYLINLKLNNFLLQVERFKAYIPSDSPIYNFLYDMEHFDYTTFDLTWITTSRLSKGLLQEIYNNPTAKEHIAQKFREKFLSSKLSEVELELYFDHFT